MTSNGPNEAKRAGALGDARDVQEHVNMPAAPAAPAAPRKVPKPSRHERLERVLDDIAIHRIQMRQAAQVLLDPVHKVERVRQQVGGAKHWLYPAAPLLALLVMRLGFLPRARALPALALRAWGIWRLIARFR